MKKLLPALLLLTLMPLGAVKLAPAKQFANHPLRQHPYIQSLQRQTPLPKGPKPANFDKLLVILVEFQEETSDDPNTTGNGKFQLTSDPNYLYSVASPPHDRQYFQNNLEALRFYYQAVSAGSYNLQYDVYPQTGAYVLPHPMGYYNPPGAESGLFVSRMEEYFKEAFELADSLSPEIDFSSYGHYMIIHAGSDWQHDIFGDTPSDIPSFFINVSSGKEASVDGGSVLIGEACNVPATISQDFSDQTEDGVTYHSGYGALNAVIAHEFGHSLGFVDLYNVYNWQPMVGVFDIMDSGGSGILVDALEDGSYVLLEGALPVFPGAWSRSLVFGDYLSQQGYLKDIDQIELFSNLDLTASSVRQTSAIKPEILRVPLSSTEYILIENRNVDPDNDGGTAVNATPDKRVILHPTPFGDPNDNPTYEYDYLLPSFQKADGSAIGGGILVWRINNDLIYNQGFTDSEGNWVSNYANNSINTQYQHRGVKIIEADNLPDIGYDWSWYWTGTQYEYFHARKPILDGSGFFVNWSQEDWKPTLSSSTLPPLTNSQGEGSFYWLSGIGNPAANMNLALRSGFFTDTDVFPSGEAGVVAGPTINSSYSDLDIPLIGSDSIRLLSRTGYEWADLMGPYPWNSQPIDHELMTVNQNPNVLKELVMVHGNAVEIVEFAWDELHSMSINFPHPVSTAPLALRDTLFISTGEQIASVRANQVLESVPVSGVRKLCAYGADLAALCSDLLLLLDSRDLFVKQMVELPEPCGAYEPVSFTTNSGNSMLFIMADSGNVYRYQNGSLNLIYQNNDPVQPTQMGITRLQVGEGSFVRPVVFWGQGNRIFALKHDGTLIGGFPYIASALSFLPGKPVYSLFLEDEVWMYLPVESGNVAFNLESGIAWDKALGSTGASQPGILLEGTSVTSSFPCYWYYGDQHGNVFVHKNLYWYDEFGIIWNGFRNGGDGSILFFNVTDETPASQDFSAFVFPNPVTSNQMRVHINNFSEEVLLDVFDINGSKVLSRKIQPDGILVRDILLDNLKLSSGVYIMSLRSGTQTIKQKFAVQK